MNKHTAGPWYCKVNGPSAKIIARGTTIATIISTSGAPNDEKKANASLIAAAPELLAELENMVAFLRGKHWAKDETFPYALEHRASAAIRKAKGE